MTIFALFYFVLEGNFPSTSPGGAYFRRGDFTEGFLCYEFGGGGNFTVVSAWDSNMVSSFKSAFTRILNEILVNFLVSASNQLGKVWEEAEEENLVSVVKIVKRTREDSGRGSVKFEEGFLPFTQAFPYPL